MDSISDKARKFFRDLTQGLPPADALRALFAAEDALYGVQQEAAVAYGSGRHPKHKFLDYFDFFCRRIPTGATVLDIGCSSGELSHQIATRCNARVTAVEVNPAQLEKAKAQFSDPRITYVLADIRDRTCEPCRVVVMSNVLEHLDQRVELVRRLARETRAECFLFRVPMFERDWRIPLRRELGANYFLDPSHRIEYSREEWEQEVQAMGLTLVHQQLNWGEIWAECRTFG